MKNQIVQTLLVATAVISLSVLMGFTRPASDDFKQYIVVYQKGLIDNRSDFQDQVNQKIAEGWHPMGGVSMAGNGLMQAMVK